MKNIQGTTEDLELFNKNGKIVYKYCTYSDGFSWESTYDEKGNQLIFKDSKGYSSESTYDEKGNKFIFKDSKGYSSESTYDERGNELTYKDSRGVTREFNVPEYTMEELVAKIGNFKIKK